MDIVVWLRSLGLGKYEAAFQSSRNLTAEDLPERVVCQPESELAELLVRDYFRCGRRGHRWPNHVNSCVRSSCNCPLGIRCRPGCRTGFCLLTRSVWCSTPSSRPSKSRPHVCVLRATARSGRHPFAALPSATVRHPADRLRLNSRDQTQRFFVQLKFGGEPSG